MDEMKAYLISTYDGNDFNCEGKGTFTEHIFLANLIVDSLAEKFEIPYEEIINCICAVKQIDSQTA